MKHVATVESGYLGKVFGRPFPEPLPWMAADAEPNADMLAAAGESRDDIVELNRRIWVHSDTTIADLGLDASGTVAWWPTDRKQVTLHQILVHMIAETDRHAGHADIFRELIDRTAGWRAGSTNLAPGTRRGPTAATGSSRSRNSPAEPRPAADSSLGWSRRCWTTEGDASQR